VAAGRAHRHDRALTAAMSVREHAARHVSANPRSPWRAARRADN
jgi:ribosomal protein L31E